MAQKKQIDDKRLTKKQVLEIIKAEGKLHKEYTNFFEEKYVTGYIQQDKVYELTNDRFLYVFDEKDGSIGGKGDIFCKDYFLKRIAWHQRVRDDYANGRGNSVDHWKFYSSYKTNFNDYIQELVAKLAERIDINPAMLNNSYESLDIVSQECKKHQLEQLFAEWYDLLVAYVGEVIKKRVNGAWDLNVTHSGGSYPFISIDSKYIQYMPINVVWDTITGLEDIDLRKQAANEIRRNASAAKFEKDFGAS
jgi:hypothetical protein